MVRVQARVGLKSYLELSLTSGYKFGFIEKSPREKSGLDFDTTDTVKS